MAPQNRWLRPQEHPGPEEADWGSAAGWEGAQRGPAGLQTHVMNSCEPPPLSGRALGSLWRQEGRRPPEHRLQPEARAPDRGHRFLPSRKPPERLALDLQSPGGVCRALPSWEGSGPTKTGGPSERTEHSLQDRRRGDTRYRGGQKERTAVGVRNGCILATSLIRDGIIYHDREPPPALPA